MNTSNSGHITQSSIENGYLLVILQQFKGLYPFHRHSMSKYLKGFGMNETTGRIIDIRHPSRRIYAYFISSFLYIYITTFPMFLHM